MSSYFSDLEGLDSPLDPSFFAFLDDTDDEDPAKAQRTRVLLPLDKPKKSGKPVTIFPDPADASSPNFRHRKCFPSPHAILLQAKPYNADPPPVQPKEGESPKVSPSKAPPKCSQSNTEKSESVGGQKDEQEDEEDRKSRNPMRASVKRQFTKTRLCRYFIYNGRCSKNTQCSFAHHPDEMAYRPNLTKTKLCKAYEQGNCRLAKEDCEFAHGTEDLQVTFGLYKTQMCVFYPLGKCKYGPTCRHAHSTTELRPKKSC